MSWLLSNRKYLAFILLLTVLCSMLISMLIVPAKASELTVSASRDAMVAQDAPDTNYGDLGLITCKDLNESAKRLFLWFDCSSLQDVSTVSSVSLRFFVDSISAGYYARPMQIFWVNTSWSETSLTWNSMPEPTAITVSCTSPWRPYGFSGAWYEYDVSALVQTALMSGRDFSLLIKFADESTVAYSDFTIKSKESNAPYLTFTYGYGTHLFAGLTSDGYSYVIKDSFLEAWNWSSTSTVNVYSNLDYFEITNRWVEGSFAIKRGYVYFDTSTIPDNAIITSATLYLYGNDIQLFKAEQLLVLSGQPTYPHIPLAASDYARHPYDANRIGGNLSLQESSFIGIYNTIELNAVGLSFINQAGYTKLCLRFASDVDYVAPDYTVVYHRALIDSAEKGYGYWPKLIVDWKIEESIGPFVLEGTNPISNTAWDSNKKELTFETMGVALFDSGTYGKPSKVLVNSGVWSDWTYDDAARQVTVNNLASSVLISWAVEQPSSGGALPSESTPPSFPPIQTPFWPVLPPLPKEVVDLGTTLIVCIVLLAGIVGYVQRRQATLAGTWEKSRERPKAVSKRRSKAENPKWKRGKEAKVDWEKHRRERLKGG